MTTILETSTMTCAVIKALNRQQANTLIAYLNY